MVSSFDMRHTFANGFNNTTSFVAKNAGEQAFWIQATQSVRISVAQCSKGNFNSDFTRLRGGHNHIHDLQRLFRFHCYGGFAFDGLPKRFWVDGGIRRLWLAFFAEEWSGGGHL